MAETYSALRAWLDIDGLRICRDRHGDDGTLQPEHVTVITHGANLEWEPHEEGGVVPAIRVEKDYE